MKDIVRIQSPATFWMRSSKHSIEIPGEKVLKCTMMTVVKCMAWLIPLRRYTVRYLSSESNDPHPGISLLLLITESSSVDSWDYSLSLLNFVSHSTCCFRGQESILSIPHVRLETLRSWDCQIQADWSVPTVCMLMEKVGWNPSAELWKRRISWDSVQAWNTSAFILQ